VLLMTALKRLLDQPTRFLFFTGKGGVGKTSLSSATAIALADAGRRVLLVSTDPASNLSEVLATPVGQEPSPVTGASHLDALDIDPGAAAAAYRDRVVGPYRGILPDSTIAGIEEQLSGACTVEIAAFDEFTGLLADPAATADYDHVVFDTAPTGHTLRLLALPSAWTGFLDTSTTGVTCIGPLSGLTQAQDRYRIALQALADPAQTTLVLVTRPDVGAVAEAERASAELRALGIGNQHLVINGVFEATDLQDVTAAGLERRHAEVLQTLPAGLAGLPSDRLPLLSGAPLGAVALRDMLDGVSPDRPDDEQSDLATTTLAEVADELAAAGRGLLMTMGKGGVGKTTVAAALAVDLARRGLPVTLTTTDPAAHVDAVLGDGDRPAGLVVERVDPAAATARYVDEVMATAGADLDADGLAVLEEDLRSPCTEEIAVFRAFAATVSDAADRIVVLDTAPTGHTLLLLDAAESYHRELLRHGDQAPPDVAALLDRLRDPDFTRVLVVTLPEPTPVHEAAELQVDLERAGIEPAAWIVNQSLRATATSDPTLLARAGHEQRWLAEVRSLHASLAVVPWQPEPPVTTDALLRLTRRG
jgi:arsenite/tail-anchored protein-transporting ATPase